MLINQSVLYIAFFRSLRCSDSDKCLTCNYLSELSFENCRSCSYPINVIDGIYSFSFDQTQNGDGFRVDFFSELAKLEENNFWFNARNNLIIWLMEFFGNNFKSFLEIGCGTGFVLKAIHHKFPSKSLFGSELFIEGLKFATKRVPSATFMQMDARSLPLENEFICIGIFDFLEHIDEDEIVLQNIYRALNDNRLLFISVTQHNWLWSTIDEMACHVRRYDSQDLSQKLKKQGFKILFSSSFVFSLLPLIFVSRFMRSKKNIDESAELKLPFLLNSVFEKILNIEVF